MTLFCPVQPQNTQQKKSLCSTTHTYQFIIHISYQITNSLFFSLSSCSCKRAKTIFVVPRALHVTKPASTLHAMPHVSELGAYNKYPRAGFEKYALCATRTTHSDSGFKISLQWKLRGPYKSLHHKNMLISISTSEFTFHATFKFNILYLVFQFSHVFQFSYFVKFR